AARQCPRPSPPGRKQRPRFSARRGDSAARASAGRGAANRQYLARVDGGVVRSTVSPEGSVAVVIGGGSGHYPAFAGLVGVGLAAASACGNIFASPAAAQVYRVAKAAQRGGGVLMSYGNYAGDILHFGQAQDRLNAEGIETRTVVVTDDIASAPKNEIHKRRGIAGDLTVFKIAGASAERGDSLDDVERLAIKANDRTRSLGVAFDSPTLPGADDPLFTVPEGQFSLGLGIHGEPGISEHDHPTAEELAGVLISHLLDDRPEGAGDRVVVLVNGLGTVKYEELFVLYGHIDRLLGAEGLTIVEPEVGELVTSLNMAGLSVTLFWVDDELEELWAAPADTPAFRKGNAPQREHISEDALQDAVTVEVVESSDDEKAAATVAAGLLDVIRATVEEHEAEFGRIDAIAGDGDHGIGMRRGIEAATDAAANAVSEGYGFEQLMVVSADAWSEKAGGTSGALWATALTAFATTLPVDTTPDTAAVAKASRAALDAIQTLGKAEVGDKTMIDALAPFVESLEAQAAENVALPTALAEAASVSRAAADATSTLRPKVGRARPLAEKSIGHPDAGAISLSLILTALSEAVLSEAGPSEEKNA
ncbi:dihydroxyacetone kinase family protein, partial [Marisediminicola senii]|uniref:dihydroxyacetone kinase family protein n=1 Tax=Marisediminicola senii TaxID=2711233 RepID=UPI0013EC159B